MRKLALISLATVLLAPAQEPPGAADRERGLWSTEFRQSRASTPAAAKSPPQASQARPQNASLMIGLTAWRLRPSQPSERFRLLAHETAQAPATSYTPERIGGDTTLSDGDRVRITVEPSRSGYLYIASREVYADGSFGDAYLVFPSRHMHGGRPTIAPGEIVEVPEWNNPVPFLKLERGRPDQSGEQLFLLLTQRELSGLMVESKPLKLPAGVVAEWIRRWGTGVRMLDSPGQKGSVLSAPEQRAASDAVKLQPGDPLPQILFRAPASTDDGLFATFTLRLKP